MYYFINRAYAHLLLNAVGIGVPRISTCSLQESNDVGDLRFCISESKYFRNCSTISLYSLEQCERRAHAEHFTPSGYKRKFVPEIIISCWHGIEHVNNDLDAFIPVLNIS